jgi:hypothetical protein
MVYLGFTNQTKSGQEETKRLVKTEVVKVKQLQKEQRHCGKDDDIRKTDSEQLNITELEKLTTDHTVNIRVKVLILT